MGIVLVLVAAVAVVAVVGYLADSRKMKANVRALGLDAPDARMVECPGPMFCFGVKQDEGYAYAVNDIRAAPVRIPLQAVVGCEIVDPGERRMGIGRGVSQFLVGGAITDTLSGSRDKYVLRILLEDEDGARTVEYRLAKPTYVEDFRRFASEVSAMIDEITGHSGGEQ